VAVYNLIFADSAYWCVCVLSLPWWSRPSRLNLDHPLYNLGWFKLIMYSIVYKAFPVYRRYVKHYRSSCGFQPHVIYEIKLNILLIIYLNDSQVRAVVRKKWKSMCSKEAENSMATVSGRRQSSVTRFSTKSTKFFVSHTDQVSFNGFLYFIIALESQL